MTASKTGLSAKVLHVVSMSGGKDSTATALIALATHPRENLRFVFADTGNEHDVVHEYLAYLEERLDIKIKRLKVNFDRQIAGKRKFIANDQRTGRRYSTIKIKDEDGTVIRKKKVGPGRRVRWSNKSKRRALNLLRPTGNPFLDLCLWKGRFPSRRAQFCTQFLKTEPLNKYQLELVDEGYVVVSWQGVRRDESPSRANVLAIEELTEDMWAHRPIADWTAEQVFDLHDQHNVEPNPLYRQGMGRVGCMPCINANKGEIREISKRFPEHVERVAEWERMVTQTSKLGGSSFFPNLDRDPIDKPDIYAVVAWSKTVRGGRKIDLFAEQEPEACASSYGLCE